MSHSVNSKGEIRTIATIKRETYITLEKNKDFNKKGAANSTVEYYYKITTFDYSAGDKTGVKTTVKREAAKPREGNTKNPPSANTNRKSE